MNYNEFSKIKYFLSFHPSEQDQKVIFSVNRDAPYQIAEKERQFYQNQYGNMSYDEFKKQYNSYLPKFNHKKHHRETLINEFKSLKTEDFGSIPLDTKLDYLDAFSIDWRSSKEWQKDYTGAYDNLVACLWSIQPSSEFLTEEQNKINHFINMLVAKKMTNDLRNLELLDIDKQNNTIRLFLDTYSQAYNIEQIPINYYTPKNTKDTRGGFVTHDQWGININLNRPLVFSLEIMSLFFHESTHLRQHKMYKEAPKKYRIFTPEYSRIINISRSLFGSKQGQEIYNLDLKESHAYYTQTYFEHQANEKIYNGQLTYTSAKLPPHLARCLWLNYQR